MPKTAKIPPERAPEISHPSFVPLMARKPQRKEDKYKITEEVGKIIAFGSGNERSTALAKRHSTKEIARDMRALLRDEAAIDALPLCFFCLFCLFDI